MNILIHWHLYLIELAWNTSLIKKNSVHNAQREKVMQVMSARYSPEMKRLDLKNFHNDSSKYLNRILLSL